MIKRVCDICNEELSAKNTNLYIGRLFTYSSIYGIVDDDRISKYDICEKCLCKIIPHWDSWEERLENEYVKEHSGMRVSPDIWESYWGSWAR